MIAKSWTENLSHIDCAKLMRQHADICEEEIRFLDSSGFIQTKKAFPAVLRNKYFLYEHLRKHGRVERCRHAESVLKKSQTKKGK